LPVVRVLLRRWAELFAWLVWANIFSIITVFFISTVLSCEQGAQLLHLAYERIGFWGSMSTLYFPMWVCFVLTASSWLLVTRIYLSSATRRAYVATTIQPLQFWTVWRFCPLCLAMIPELVAAYILRSLALCMAVVTIGVVTIWPLEKLSSHVITFMPGTFRIKSSRMVIGSVAAIVLGVIYLWVAIDSQPRLSSLAALLTLAPAWSLIVSGLFIALPKACGLPSLAAVPILLTFVMGVHRDTNIFPHRSLDISPLPGLRPSSNRRTLSGQLDKWAEQYTTTPGNSPIPLYLISAEGGGVRAAYWSAAVLANIDAQTSGGFRRHALLYSGVSGGSLGVTAFASAAYHDGISCQQLPGLMDRFFKADFLRALVVPLLSTELLRRLFGEHKVLPSRDQVFENLLASEWQSNGGGSEFNTPFLEVFKTDKWDRNVPFAPIMWLNSTVVETGQRAAVSNTSIYSVFPNALDLLADDPNDSRALDSLTVAEAVHLSARFPYVSPPASIETAVAPKEDPMKRERRLWGHLVDGGYLDNSAADGFISAINEIDAIRKESIRCHDVKYINCGPNDKEAQRLSDVVMRIQIVVIVIRNDPYEKHAASIYEVPFLVTLNRNTVLRGLPACEDCGFFNDGFLEQTLPHSWGSLELAGPVVTILAARDARGALTRGTVQRRLEDTSTDSGFMSCKVRLFGALKKTGKITRRDMTDVGLADDYEHLSERLEMATDYYQQSVEAEIECENRRKDKYEEYSLGKLLDHAPQGQCRAKVGSAQGVRDIALGWTLDEQARATIGCLATQIAAPRELLAYEAMNP
jgi:predicted acylesterase/phospholipase RssA